jgi:outer membrane lipoprotein SlyB
VLGAVIGVGVGLLFGLRGKGLAQVAGVGALSGGVNVAAEAGRSVVQIVNNCMAGRGYKVL